MAVKLVLDAGGSRLSWASLVNGVPAELTAAPWDDARSTLEVWWQHHRDATDSTPPVIGMLDRPATPAAEACGFPEWIPVVFGVDPVRLDPYRDCPFDIDYREGLPGHDRLAAALACHQRDPGGSWVIVDAGTCITVDLLSPGRWRGGAILPGLALQSKAMTGAGLPILERSPDGWTCRTGAEGALGRTTTEALEAGIPWASRESVTAVIRALIDIDPCAQVILTGGDAAHFDGIGGWRTFADPKLVLIGTSQLLNATTS